MRAARDILSRNVRAIAALAVALALLSTPVQCALAHGPHSLFVPAAMGAPAAASDDAHRHHHGHAAPAASDPVAFTAPAASAARGNQATAMPVAPASRPGLPAALAENPSLDPGIRAAPAATAEPGPIPAGRRDTPPEPPPP